jgi:beta-lactamase regulating signal transducer with metallopeptidase domain
MLWWTLQNLVVATLLAGLAQILCRVGRIGPVGRHALWLIVLVKLLTPPLVVLNLPWSTPLEAIEPSTTGVTALTLNPPTDTPVIAIPPSDLTSTTSDDFKPATVRPFDELRAALSLVERRLKPDTTGGLETGSRSFENLPIRRSPNPSMAIAAEVRRWLPWTAWIWLAGGLAFTVIQGVRIGRVVLSLRRAGPANQALVELVEALARRLRMRPVPIRVVRGISSPSIWCVHRAQLLWPAELPPPVSENALRGLIVHELAHVKRGDHWVGWIELAAGCVWWWNPLFWYVRAQLRENAELACDGWVIDTLPYGRRAYAEALLTVCAGLGPGTAPMPAVGIGTGSRHVLERRLVMIMRERIPLRLSRTGLSSVVMLTLATQPVRAQRPANSVVEPERPPAVLVVPEPQPAPVVPVVTAVTVAQTRTPRQPLPDDARKLIDRFSEQQAEAHREAEEKIARQRHDLIGKLQQIQDTYTKAGRLDEAVEVRDFIRELTRPGSVVTNSTSSFRFVRPTTYSAGEVRLSPPSTSGPVFSGSFSLQSLRGRIGQTMTVPVIGATEGTIWGNGVYTDDSSLAVAAVHAGIVAPGRLGFVRVTVLPGQDHYEGATKNDVTSYPYEKWGGSYRLERDPDPSPVIRLGDQGDAGTSLSLQSFRGQAGVSMTVEVVGAASGQTIWGTNEYTDDSSLAVAAVHAGILLPGERGLVKVTILPGRDSYIGSEHNGVQSAPYDSWGGSFRVERATPK